MLVLVLLQWYSFLVQVLLVRAQIIATRGRVKGGVAQRPEVALLAVSLDSLLLRHLIAPLIGEHTLLGAAHRELHGEVTELRQRVRVAALVFGRFRGPTLHRRRGQSMRVVVVMMLAVRIDPVQEGELAAALARIALPPRTSETPIEQSTTLAPWQTLERRRMMRIHRTNQIIICGWMGGTIW